eukprot:SRR837773.14035.p2 GENE.SRR837773.14035~~SRR837773.14035.p2  ORF type:complete len:148 (+),score=51.73 SRR837773.14035:357-800(+)
MLSGVLQGAIAWIVPYSMIGTTEYDKTQPGQFWVCSTVVFTAINFIVWFKLILYSESPFKMTTTVSTLGAIFCYFGALGCLSYTPLGKSFQPSMWQIPGDVVADTKNLTAGVAAIALALLLDVVVLVLQRLLWPSELMLAKRGVAQA